MRIRSSGLVALGLVVALDGAGAGAGTQTILGQKLDVRNPSADNLARRRILVVAKEGPETLDTLEGDPTVGGATLRVVAQGASAVYDQTFDLPAAGWKATFTRHEWPVYAGFTYTNKTTGGPVRRVIVKRSGYASPEGTPPPEVPKPGIFRITVRVVGRDGPIDVLPPNPGTAGGIVLTLGTGDSYCVGFGSGAGGDVLADTERRFAIRRPTGESCPPGVVAASTTSTSTTATSTTTSTTGTP
jgi:hypothetical protein